MAADKSHLYINAGLPVNEYVSSGLLQDDSKPMGFANTASTNVFTGPHVGEMPMQFANVASSVPQINDAGTTSNGMTVPTNRYPTDAQMGALYQQQRELAGVRTFGVPHDDWVEANANKPSGNVSATIAGGGNRSGVAQAAPIPNVLTSQNLFQRNPSGSVYAPDLSAYNDSSLFNYTGPGGVDEYTYGQDLPYQGAGYDIWGSPTNVPNPYYEGQFAPEPVVTEPQGPADGAIGMSPIEMPVGVPSTNTPITPSAPDLTYAETLAEMGIDPADAPSTTFPSPGDTVAPTLGTPSPHGDWNDFLSPETVVDDDGLPVPFDFVGDTADDRFRPPPFLGKPLPHTGEKDFLPTDVPAIGTEATEPFDFVGDTADDRFRPEDYLDADIANNRPMNFAYHAGGAGSPHLGEGTPMGFADAAGGNNLVTKEGPKTGYSGLGGRDLITDTADSRFRPEGSPDAGDVNSTLARDVAAGMLKNQQELQAKGQALQDRYDAFEAPIIRDNIFNEHFDRNQAEYTPSIRDVTDATPMQLHEGEVINIEKEGPKTGPSGLTADDLGGLDYSADERFRRTPQSIADVDIGARPMNFADAAGGNNLVTKEGPKTGPSGQGGRTSLFDEQQNYQVPAEEISPGEVGLLNGIVEGLQNYGPNSDRTLLEDKAWDKYYDYKDAGAEALNKGEIDAQAFNELDKGNHPVINSLFTNAANVLYQGVQTIATDQTIAEGIKDIWQQGSGANDSTPLGSVVEEIARAKEATQQRKEQQENIFTPGPMKLAATASKPKPVVVKKSKPVRTPVVTKKVTPKKTVKTGPSGRTARNIGYSFSSGPVGRRYGL